MDAPARLDYALFQLTPTRTSWSGVTWCSSMVPNQTSWHLGYFSPLFLTSSLFKMRFLEVAILLLFAHLPRMHTGSPNPHFKDLCNLLAP